MKIFSSKLTNFKTNLINNIIFIIIFIIKIAIIINGRKDTDIKEVRK